jgi:hypothetical protein
MDDKIMESGSISGRCSPVVNEQETQTHKEYAVDSETFVERSRKMFYSRQMPVSKEVETFASKSTDFSYAITHEQTESVSGVIPKEDAIEAVSAIFRF